MHAKVIVARILIGLFVVTIMLILIGSVMLAFDKDQLTDKKSPPSGLPSLPAEIYTTPDTLKTKFQLTIYTQHVEVYKKHVEAYGAYLTAYSKYLESKDKYGKVEIYNVIVKDTLAPIVTALITVLAAFAFAHTGMEVLNNYLLIKSGNQPRDLSRFL